MMAQIKKVLACVDHSHYAEHVADYAAWSAQRLGAPLEFLHVIDRHPEMSTGSDHSGAIGIDAQESLLAELSEADEARSKAARERGRAFLNSLRERVVASGVQSVDVRQRHGHLEESLAELQDDVGLFVLGRRGESAESTQRDLGRNVERTVRSLRKPILTITEDFVEPERLMVAFDGGKLTRRAVTMLASSPTLSDLPIHVIMSGKQRSDAQKQLDWARDSLAQAGYQVETALIPGDAERVIADAITRLSIDMLIMGAYSHSPLRSLFVGSKTSDLLRAVQIPTLLMR